MVEQDFINKLLAQHAQGLYDALITTPDLAAFNKKADEICQERIPEEFTAVDLFRVFTCPSTVQIGSQSCRISLWQAANAQSYDLAKEGTVQYQLWERMHALMNPDSRIAASLEDLESWIATLGLYQKSENTRAIKAAVHKLLQLFEIKYQGKNFFQPLADNLLRVGVTPAMSHFVDIERARRNDILHQLVRHVSRRTRNLDFEKIKQLIDDLKSFHNQSMPAVAYTLNTSFAMPFQMLIIERQPDASASRFIQDVLSAFDIKEEQNFAYVFQKIKEKIESPPVDAQKVADIINLLNLLETYVGQVPVWHYLNRVEESQKSIYQLVQAQAANTQDLDHPIHALLQDMESYEPEAAINQASAEVMRINGDSEDGAKSSRDLLRCILSPDPSGSALCLTSLENFDFVIRSIDDNNAKQRKHGRRNWYKYFNDPHGNTKTETVPSLYETAMRHGFHGAPNGSAKQKIWVRMHQLMQPEIKRGIWNALQGRDLNQFKEFCAYINLQKPHHIKAVALAIRESNRIDIELNGCDFGKETRRADLQIAIRLNITTKPLTRQNIKNTMRKIEQLRAITTNADMIDFFNAPCDTGSSKASLYERVTALNIENDASKKELVEIVACYKYPHSDTIIRAEEKEENHRSEGDVSSVHSNNPVPPTRPRDLQPAKPTYSSSSSVSNSSPAAKIYLAWGMIFVALTIIAGLTFSDDHQLMTDGVEKTGDWSSKMSDTAAQGTGMGVYILIGLAAGVFAAWIYWPAVGSTMSFSLPGRSSGQHTYSQLDRQMRNG